MSWVQRTQINVRDDVDPPLGQQAHIKQGHTAAFTLPNIMRLCLCLTQSLQCLATAKAAVQRPAPP